MSKNGLFLIKLILVIFVTGISYGKPERLLVVSAIMRVNI
jgi:hypothetical protein